MEKEAIALKKTLYPSNLTPQTLQFHMNARSEARRSPVRNPVRAPRIVGKFGSRVEGLGLKPRVQGLGFRV